MAYFPPTGSIVSYQSVPSSLLSGASIFGQLPAGTAVLGSVATLQGTNPWITTFSNSSILTVPNANQSVSGTVLVNNGSVVAFQSLPSSLLTGASIFGQLPAGTATLGSVIAYQGAASWNVGGSVLQFQAGTQVSSLVSTVPSSVIVGASMFGQLPAGTGVLGSVATLQGTNPWNIAGSVLQFQAGTQISSLVNTVPSSVIVGASMFGQLPAGTAVLGSVATLQGTNPWIVTFSNSSIFAAEQGTWINSVISANASSMLVGAYAQRNDAIASFLGGNKTWNPLATDSAGRILTKPFSSEDGTIINFVSSTVSTSVMLIKASAIGMKNYVTDFWISNTGANTTLITFQDGSTSVLGYTIAPAGGGSNAQGIHIPLKTATAQDLALKATTGTSVLYVTVQGYQAP